MLEVSNTPSLAHEPNGSRYLDGVDERIAQAARQPKASWKSVLRAAAGAFPATVADRLTTLGLPVSPQVTGQRVCSKGPEEHCLASEWYFTDSTASRLAELRGRGSLACLGTPTVAKAARASEPLLVDTSAFAAARGYCDGRSVRQLRHDLRTTVPRTLERTADTVILDPPWHLLDTLAWLSNATTIVRQAGLLAMPLPQELTKRRAREERGCLIGIAAGIGRVEIVEDAVTYRTPAFEAAVLAAHGLPEQPSWRRADLLLIHDVRRALPPVRHRPRRHGWVSFDVGGATVALRLRRRRRRQRTETFTHPVGDFQSYFLPTIKRSEWQSLRIDVWTSRNRVARVTDPVRAFRALQYLAGGETKPCAVDGHVIADAAELASILDLQGDMSA